MLKVLLGVIVYSTLVNKITDEDKKDAVDIIVDLTEEEA